MTTTPVIDSDAHVDETRRPGEFIPQESAAFKPVLDLTPSADPTQPPTPSWLIDGVKKRRPVRDDAMARSTVETRELLDVEARLRRMDELGIDMQVVYPTLFITERRRGPRLSSASPRATTAGSPTAARRPRGGCAGYACLPC